MSICSGGHCQLNGYRLDEIRAIYPKASAKTEYTVALIDRAPSLGKTRYYLDAPDGDRICVYRRHILGTPRCGYCEQEGHTKSAATGKNCEFIRKEQEEARDQRAKERAAKKAAKAVA